MGVERQWALVLGSSSGSGLAIARAVAEEPGLNVYGMHRGNHVDGAAEAREHVKRAGRTYDELVAEAGKEEGIGGAIETIGRVIPPGGIRLFVHAIANASIGYLADGPELLHRKQIEKTFNSMAHSFVYWVRALVRSRLLAPGAQLLALTNAMNDSSLANLAAIAASKAALETYVRYLAWELGPKGYRVNALKFGTAETAALKWIFPSDVWTEARDVHHRMHPAGRMIELDDVGRFVSVLAGERATWFNGAVIDFTGGQMNSVYQFLMDEVLAAARRNRRSSDET